MAEFVIRNVEEDVAANLKKRANRRGRSMEDEVRHTLRDAARDEHRGVRELGSRIVARFKTVGLAVDLPEVHGQSAYPAKFDQ